MEIDTSGKSVSSRKSPNTVTKLAWTLPWLLRYPAWRAKTLLHDLVENGREHHVIVTVANHFEPGYNEQPNDRGGFGVSLDVDEQLRRFDNWARDAYVIGNAVHDCDGTPFRHTNFYPAEQYHREILERLSQLQSAGFGEVEIHLHHGVDEPDTKDNLRRTIVDFRDRLAEEHKCLSREGKEGSPQYAFIHGNWALANSAKGKFCGVDSEMEILAETGCYADLTLPSARRFSSFANQFYISMWKTSE